MKYECSYCGDSLKPCVVGHDDRRPVKLLGVCPFRRHARPRWEPVLDKPDPQSSVPQDGEIVELIDRELPDWVWREKFKKVAQAIEAKIEAVWSLFRNHESRMNDLAFDIDRHEGDVIAAHQRCEDLERKVGVLEGWIKTIGIHSRQLACLDESELGRKVEALGSDLCRHMYPSLTPQPARADEGSAEQPFALDEEGKKHPLIPGRSVIAYIDGGKTYRGLFHRKVSTQIWAYWELSGITTFMPEDRVTWLCDLDFPGGDK